MKTRKINLIDTFKVEVSEENIEPNLNDNQVLVKVIKSGICGSDLHYFRNAGLGQFRQELPMSLGHEASGYVVESRSKKFKSDDKVGIEPALTCKNCSFCLSDRQNLCPDVIFLGANTTGAFSDYLIVDESQLIKSDKYSYAGLALIEPFGVALHNFKLAQDLENSKSSYENIGIIGGGPIAALIGIIIKNQHKDKNIKIIEPVDKRRNLLKNFFEENEIHNTDTENLEKKFDLIFEVVGSQNSIQIAENTIDNGGNIVFVGIPEIDNLIINPHKLRINEVTTVFSRRCALELKTVFNSFDSLRIDEKLFITDEFVVEDAQYAFELANSQKCMKVQIDFSDYE